MTLKLEQRSQHERHVLLLNLAKEVLRLEKGLDRLILTCRQDSEVVIVARGEKARHLLALCGYSTGADNVQEPGREQ